MGFTPNGKYNITHNTAPLSKTLLAFLTSMNHRLTHVIVLMYTLLEKEIKIKCKF